MDCMDYNKAINYIHGTYKFGIKLGLHNIRRLLDNMGNPQNSLKFVHVAGTNGKGSVVTYIASVLISAGYKVGVFTSPYIEEFEERITINKNKIDKSDLSRITWYVKNIIDKLFRNGFSHPTEFEIITAIAMEYFYENTCDIAILEVGLGGQFDSTNVIESPLVSVITSISYDHMDILGDTIEKIAFEKAGIIKENSSVVIYPQEQAVIMVIEGECKKKGVSCNIVSFESLNVLDYNCFGQKFNYKNYNNIEIMLHGNYQVKNAILAIESLEILMQKGFNISETDIRNGLKSARWPGRFEILSKKPYVLVDGGHNYQGISELVDEINRYFPISKKVFIIGIMENKEYEKMIELLSKIAYVFIVFNTNNHNAVEPTKLISITKKYCKDIFFSDKIEEAFRLAIEITNKEDLICLCGSLYIIGDFKKMIREVM